MSLKDVSPRADQIYELLKKQGVTDEDKMASGEAITHWARLPKGHVMAGLDELVKKGHARRRNRDKSSGYWAVIGQNT